MICNKCDVDRPEQEYYKRKNGSLYKVCKPCERLRAKENRTNGVVSEAQKRYRSSDKGREKRIAQGERYRKRVAKASGRDYISRAERSKAAMISLEIASLRRIANNIKIKQSKRKPWNADGLLSSDRYRIRYQSDPEFNLKERIRRQVAKKAKRDGIATIIREAVKRNGTSPTVQNQLGWTIKELMQRLEGLFTNGMSWENMDEWHIDHIKPQCLFDMSDDEQFVECWSLDNLQPLWARDNLIKSNKYESVSGPLRGC